MPLLKIGGEALCFKGPAVREELLNAKRALKLLGGTVKEVEERPLPWGTRTIAVLQKTAATPAMYPRKAGTPAKTPL